MRLRVFVGILGAGLTWLGSGVMAQGIVERRLSQCAALPAPFPPRDAGGATPAPRTAARDEAGLVQALLAEGVAVEVALSPATDVRYALPPEKPGTAASFGGLVAFDVKDAGLYRVALRTGAWIDLLEGGKPVASTGHSHGPGCSGVRKMVDFPLKPGRHILQISGNATATTAVRVTRQP